MVPEFSIIIPCYNLEGYIQETLDSVLAQTYENWECICINDGSTDQSGEILDQYAKRDSRFVVIHQPNGGVARARNVGLEVAKGKWLAFLDGDDLWHPQLLEICEHALKKHPNCQAVRFAYELVDNPRMLLADIGRISQFSSSVISCAQWTRESCYPVFKSYVYSRELVSDVRFLELIVGEDCAWATDCLARMRSFVDLSQMVLYAYRRRPGSAVHSKFTARKLKDEIIWRSHRVKSIIQAKRPVVPEVCWDMTKSLTLNYSKLFFQIPRSERISAWQIWLREMKDILPGGIISGWCYWAARICLFTRSQLVFWLAFRLPLWVKQYRFRESRLVMCSM